MAQKIWQHQPCESETPVSDGDNSWRVGYAPRKLQLTESNTTSRIVLPRRSKFDILWFGRITEPRLRSFVKAVTDQIEVFCKRRFIKNICRHFSKGYASLGRDTPFKKSLALNVTN